MAKRSKQTASERNFLTVIENRNVQIQDLFRKLGQQRTEIGSLQKQLCDMHNTASRGLKRVQALEATRNRLSILLMSEIEKNNSSEGIQFLEKGFKRERVLPQIGIPVPGEGTANECARKD